MTGTPIVLAREHAEVLADAVFVTGRGERAGEVFDALVALQEALTDRRKPEVLAWSKVRPVLAATNVYLEHKAPGGRAQVDQLAASIRDWFDDHGLVLVDERTGFTAIVTALALAQFTRLNPEVPEQRTLALFVSSLVEHVPAEARR